MKPHNIILKTFIGYQINSSYHCSKDFSVLASSLNDFLLANNTNIQLEFEFGEFPPGAKFWDEIQKKIESSHITIFDISENNPNVLLETGIAIDSGAHVILLKSEKSNSPHPSDLSSFIYLTYPRGEYLSSHPILESIASSIKYFLNKHHDPYFYHKLLWDLSPSSSTLIIPGKLPPKYIEKNRFEDFIHIKKFSDLDAVLLVMETLHRLYPKMDISISHGKSINELPKNWEHANLILIGGPDFNPIAAEFDKMCPIGYRYGSNDEVWLYHKFTGKEYKPEFSMFNGKKRAKDYGFFLKRNQSHFNLAKLIFIGGARTWGVHGAAALLSCKGADRNAHGYINTRKLIDNFGSDCSFLLPVEVCGSKTGIMPPTWDISDVEMI